MVLADKCGFSFTEVLPRQLRLPTQDEAMEAIPKGMTFREVDGMLDDLRRFGELEEEDENGG